MPQNPVATELLNQLREPFTAETLFDGMHDTVYFIKNASGHYVVVNNTLVERCGSKRKSELIGRTSEEILRAPFGSSFSKQDQVVLRSGKPLIGQLERHLYPSHDVGWCLTNKHALIDRNGHRIGLVGFSRDLNQHDESGQDYQRLGNAIRFAQETPSQPVSVADMAKVAQLSRFQLDRRMRIVFGLNTGQWLLKQRIDRACELLRTTSFPIAHVAAETGYSDQSAFTRQFGRATGMSPNQYRMANRG
ncbi:MAG: helix-turn-helix domain-containing protein [Pirellulaceae bacterium]